jgi:hypothetical protein
VVSYGDEAAVMGNAARMDAAVPGRFRSRQSRDGLAGSTIMVRAQRQEDAPRF